MKKFLKEWVIPFTIEIIILWFIYNYWFFFINVPTGSMIPTIAEQSYIFSTRVHNPEKSLERGDVVVFDSLEYGYKFVKRLIGMPGETVIIDSTGTVFIDGVKLDEPYVKHPEATTGTFIIPEGHYFFLGDNRAGSNDARYWNNSYISADDINGKAVFTLWPFSNFGALE